MSEKGIKPLNAGFFNLAVHVLQDGRNSALMGVNAGFQALASLLPERRHDVNITLFFSGFGIKSFADDLLHVSKLEVEKKLLTSLGINLLGSFVVQADLAIQAIAGLISGDQTTVANTIPKLATFGMLTFLVMSGGDILEQNALDAKAIPVSPSTEPLPPAA